MKKTFLSGFLLTVLTLASGQAAFALSQECRELQAGFDIRDEEWGRSHASGIGTGPTGYRGSSVAFRVTGGKASKEVGLGEFNSMAENYFFDAAGNQHHQLFSYTNGAPSVRSSDLISCSVRSDLITLRVKGNYTLDGGPPQVGYVDIKCFEPGRLFSSGATFPLPKFIHFCRRATASITVNRVEKFSVDSTTARTNHGFWARYVTLQKR